MTPEEEIENIIQETVMHDFRGGSKSYNLTTFPETHLMKLSACYVLRIKTDYYQNDEVIRRYKEVANLVNGIKITVKNKILDRQREISMRGVSKTLIVPIYYKDCVFTNSVLSLGPYCENCIVEGI